MRKSIIYVYCVLIKYLNGRDVGAHQRNAAGSNNNPESHDHECINHAMYSMNEIVHGINAHDTNIV